MKSNLIFMKWLTTAALTACFSFVLSGCGSMTFSDSMEMLSGTLDGVSQGKSNLESLQSAAEAQVQREEQRKKR
jgi:hypothetical protein